MKILYLNQLYAPSIGGVEIFTHRIATCLQARGHEAIVVTDRHDDALPEREHVDGVDVVRLPMLRALGGGDVAAVTASLKGLAMVKREFQPDVVQINFTDASGFFHARTNSTPTPTVVAFHVPLSSLQTSGPLFERILGTADALVAVSHTAAAQLRGLVGERFAPVQVIPPGIPDRDVVPVAPSRVPLVLFVGRLVPDKAPDLVVAAASILHDHGVEVEIVLVGDGPLHDDLTSEIDRLGLHHMVQLRGHTSDVELDALRAGATVQLMPSRNDEPFGMVCIEGALAHLPVIAARRGALPEVVLDGETGAIIDPEDPDALAAAIERLIGDRDRARSLGEAGRARALRTYLLEPCADQYEELFDRIVASRRAPSR